MVRKLQTLPGYRPVLEGCRDYPLIRQSFGSSLLDSFEAQLNQYLDMENISEDYLRDVPRIVCWYEGIIDTKDIIGEFSICEQEKSTVINKQ